LLSLTLAAYAARAHAAETPDPATAASKATATTLREVGTALYHWAASERGTAPEAELKPQGEVNTETDSNTVRWSRCPMASYDEVRQLLVPKYLAELPRTDAWGHPLEICVDRANVKTHAHYVLGVRSAGADGRFDGEEYAVGEFDRADANHDLVWLDGYFMAWPMGKQAK
jgi:hypothetical protein